jgi:hypothetical protein
LRRVSLRHSRHGPYAAAAKKKEAAKWTDSRRLTPLPNVCIYVPESIDETRRTDWGWLLREGDVYVALRPVNATKVEWQTCTNDVQKGYKRLVLTGSGLGLIVEAGDAAEYGDVDTFIVRIGAAVVDASKLSDKRIDYVSSRGIPLSLRFNDTSWFPHAAVKGVPLDFEQWPICESPYVQSRAGTLDVNDGQTGFRVAWRDNVPVTTSYKVPTHGPTTP